MVISPLKALLFLTGVSAAAVSTAYISGAFDGFLKEPPAMVAALPDDGAAAKADRTANRNGPAKDAPSAGLVVEGEAQTPENKDILPPSFDLVRVEPDGSVVFAGKAAPEASVEIIAGSRVIAKATASLEGDFAVILDDPLEPGNYQIVLRSTTPDNVVATSVETAVVAIPETESGQVLALVEEPGKPSKLITVPEGTATEDATEGGKATDLVAPDPPVQDPTRAEEEIASEQPAPEVRTDAPADADAQNERAATQADETPAENDGTEPADPPATADRPDAAAEEPVAVAAADRASEMAEDVEAADPAEAAVALPADEKPAPAEKTADKAAPQVRVEAVEIEGRQVFVAGTGAPGLIVRVYANAILLGETEVSASGRFLIETERDLPVGDYIVRADLLDDGGRKVVARAAVPFQREPGEAVAAVAPLPSEAENPAETARAEEAPVVDEPDDAPAQRPQATAETVAPAANGETAADQDGDAGEAVVAAHTEPAAPAVEEVLAPKLQSVQSAVIIRRGDTLWRISRRVYGRGVRYSTIYLANEDQIEDPDRIWPGQVFRVPDTSDDGEEADMQALEDQMTTIEASGGATTAVE
ncbi:LysM peptidoglycan-binding domain-containing protein [Nitratireductor alexandrii]|uniref:LysM peptidoglycan-binding domain-containing protein n=1 Tax=Nitratireductor alexandrii TaxID=2448161 RepID=UPI000FD6CAAB|nr:LysM peptidoglycan-binding domain-containing protein [Nitratireductor alexandrii]